MAKLPKPPNTATHVPGQSWDAAMSTDGGVQAPAPLVAPVAPQGSAQTISATGQIGQTDTTPLFTNEGTTAFNQWANIGGNNGLSPAQVEAARREFARANPQYTNTGSWQQAQNAYTAAGGTTAPLSLAGQGSQTGQQAAIDALNQIRGYTQNSMTGAERDYMNAGIQRGTAQSQAAIQSLAQQAASRGAADSGGLWAAQGAAAQSGGNNAAAIGADAGMAAQNRAMGATNALLTGGLSIDAAAQGRGSSQDALNLNLLQTQLGALGTDYQMDLGYRRQRQSEEDARMNRILAPITAIGGAASRIGGTNWGGGGGS